MNSLTKEEFLDGQLLLIDKPLGLVFVSGG